MLCLMIALVSACFIACGNDDDDSFGGSGNTEVPGGTVSPERTFNVEKAGTLPDKISEVDMYKIKSLKLSGVLNGTDILFLRKMMGVSEKGAATGGQLEYLDISDTKIIEGGDGYYISSGGFSYDTSYDRIGTYMFSRARALKTILLPNGVTSIGGDAFRGCTGLTSINIPGSVTTIEGDAFSGCTSLTTINIPSSVTTIWDDAFRGCTGLTSINIPGSVTTIGSNAFSGCTSLTTISIPGSVTTIWDDAFRGCTGLTSINIPGSVTTIGSNAFSGCYRLSSVYFAGCYTWLSNVFYCGNDNVKIYVPKGSKSHYEQFFLDNEIIEYEPNNE